MPGIFHNTIRVNSSQASTISHNTTRVNPSQASTISHNTTRVNPSQESIIFHNTTRVNPSQASTICCHLFFSREIEKVVTQNLNPAKMGVLMVGFVLEIILCGIEIKMTLEEGHGSCVIQLLILKRWYLFKSFSFAAT